MWSVSEVCSHRRSFLGSVVKKEGAPSLVGQKGAPSPTAIMKKLLLTLSHILFSLSVILRDLVPCLGVWKKWEVHREAGIREHLPHPENYVNTYVIASGFVQRCLTGGAGGMKVRRLTGATHLLIT